jgi:hypothetical protein
MSTTKALEIEDQHGNVMRLEKEDGGPVTLEILGTGDGSMVVELDVTDRREVAEWLGLARG